jgi:sugar lactone lactonase YvrE
VTVADGKIHVINVDTDIGFSGDGGTLTAAVFALVNVVSVADNGDILLADTGNFRVRRVHNGILNTVVGTTIADNIPATQAFLSHPSAVLPDGKGGFLFADTDNNRIRAVASTGTITNVTGSGIFGSSQGRLAQPTGVAVDSQGALYVADTQNDRVLRIPPSGNQTTFAGGNGTGFAGDGAFAGRASLAGPSGLTFDAAGTLYIADLGNLRVRAVDTDGNINTVAGSGSPRFSGDNGPATQAGLTPFDVAFDGAGSLFIVDILNNRIRKLNLATKIITTVAGAGTPGYSGDGGPATAAQLNTPTGVAVDAAGTIYIADSGNSVIRRVKGNIITTIAGTGTSLFDVESGRRLACRSMPIA